MSCSELTICSVSYQSRFCLELNWALTKELNSRDDLAWIVVENTEGQLDERVPSDDYRFLVVEGIECNRSGDGWACKS